MLTSTRLLSCSESLSMTDTTDPKVSEVSYVYTIKFVADTGDIELDISTVHQDFIYWLSNNGGECDWDSAKVTPEVHAHIMVLPGLGALQSTPLVNSSILRLRLTDLGRRAATEIRKRRSQ